MMYIDKTSFKRIEAVQWTGENIYDVSNFCGVSVTCLSPIVNGSIRINMRHGTLTVPKDGYVVKNTRAGSCRYYVYPRDKFEQGI